MKTIKTNTKEARLLNKILTVVSYGLTQIQECGASCHTEVGRYMDLDEYKPSWLSDKELMRQAHKDAQKLRNLDKVACLPELEEWDGKGSPGVKEKEEDSYLWEQTHVDGFEYDESVHEDEKASQARAWVAGQNQRVDMEWSRRTTKAIFELMDPEGTGIATKPLRFRGTARLPKEGMMVPYPMKHVSVIQSLMYLSGSKKKGKPGFVSDSRFTYEDRGAIFTFIRASWDNVKSQRA